MAKISSDKLPVLLLCSQRGSIRLFFNTFCKDRYFFLEVLSVLELYEKLQHTKLALIILDEKIAPDIFTVCKRVRQKSQENLPFFVISNQLKKPYLKNLTLAGVTDFLREPLSIETLEASLELSKRQKMIENKMAPLTKALSPLSSSTILLEKKITIPDEALVKIKETLEAKSSLSVVLAEIPIISKVKSEWGKKAYLECEQKMRDYLRKFLRPQDFLLDVAEGKYAYILPSTSHTVAHILMDTLKENFGDKKFEISKGKVKASLSMAIVTLNEDQLQSQNAYDSLQKMLQTGESYLEKAKSISQRIVSN